VGFRSLQESLDSRSTRPPRGAGWCSTSSARWRSSLLSRPTVMTEAKTKQADRMVEAGTPLTEVAEVLGVSRTTLYRHLKTTRPGGVAAASPSRAPVAVPVVPVVPVVGERSARACPSCGHEPATREEAVQRRADLAVLWLHPEHRCCCRSPAPAGRVIPGGWWWTWSAPAAGTDPSSLGPSPRTARRVRWLTRPGGGWWPRGGAPRPTSSAPNTDSRRRSSGAPQDYTLYEKTC